MRKLWIFTILIGAALAAMLLMARTTKAEWTTNSREALQEYNLGHEARMKLYPADAREHFGNALALDSEFVAAKLALMIYSRGDERKRLAKELEESDLNRLTAREQFLVRYHLAQHEGRDKEAYQALKSFLDAYPHDPWGLAAFAGRAWGEQNWDKAEKLYRKLIDVDPNWVEAQNRLAYIAMAQGRFEEAESLLKTYQYVAPDQANPHDSMGELLTLLGRYDEARSELEQAVSIRPDFCASHLHLADVYLLEGRPEATEPVFERAAEVCEERFVEEMRCVATFWSDYFSGDLDAPWRPERARCREVVGPFFFLIHRMAVLSGRIDEALGIEAVIRERVAKMDSGGLEAKHFGGLIHHVTGARLAVQGDPEGAIEELESADELFYYWGQGEGIAKLFNRLNLAAAHELAGDEAAARKIVEKVRKVNDKFSAFYDHVRQELAS
ncbi:MAG: tetratricopeptide repeat protein [Acidobacteriota bacterium]|nr:tetratricopeptide repeat protein [Acidobacteriota bacterium]